MGVDIDKLTDALSTEAIFDQDVTGGNNGRLVTLLNTNNVDLPRRWRSISKEDFLIALASKTLGAPQQDHLRTMLENLSSIPMHNPSFRAWVSTSLVPGSPGFLEETGLVIGKLGDRFVDGDSSVEISHVREAISRIPKSYINVRAARG